MRHRLILFFILGFDAFILFYQIPELSISFSEARLLYGEPSFLQYLVQTSLSIFGENDYALRIVMIFFHLASALLLYKISKQYIQTYRNRLWLLLMFIMLPGIVSSALVVNSAGLLIFGLLLFIYLSQRFSQAYLSPLLLIFSLIDQGFLYLFLGLAVYNIFEKNKVQVFYNIALVIINIFIYGTFIGGSPKGHFLDAIGVYSAILTPIIFIYLFYNLYRRYLTNQTDMIWYISSTTLIFSLLLSIRQKVPLEYFAPYLIVSLPLAAQTFISSYRIRLKMFRTGYKAAFTLSFIFLLLNTMVVLFNKDLYLLLDKPKKHFAYDMHIAKELAQALKEKDITCVMTDEEMQLRLKFYGIKYCKKHLLKNTSQTPNVTISYRNKTIYTASVTKLNNK